MRYCYHLLMLAYCRVRPWLMLRRLRFVGWRHGLPSLGQWSDDQVVESFRKQFLE